MREARLAQISIFENYTQHELASYRTFACIPDYLAPRKSSLQATIKQISPDILKNINFLLSKNWFDKGNISLAENRVDSAVVKINIKAPK